MGLQRTTFSESWYRVADLKPRMHPSLGVWRQTYRGELWYVLEDPVNNQYFRVTFPAYQFLALLDGKRCIDDVWMLSLDQFGDDAPTQGEAIQLLGQLFNSNLLLGDIPADSQGLLRRHTTRVKKEVVGKLSNILFMKIPLWDPDRFLKMFTPLVGWAFSLPGFLLWSLMLCVGMIYAFGSAADVRQDTSGILTVSNAPWLYLGFALSKILHEFGHGFACKKLGLISGNGGPVHTLGVMLMLMTPIPYIDCSSSWAFRNKWYRVVVGLAGMAVDLVVAVIALIIWSKTAQGTVMHALAYNVMFVASVSTLLFNGNPLMRYDAYYILSDLLEIPNLAMRGQSFFLHCCKKYILGVTESTFVSGSQRERQWLFWYALLSWCYRTSVMVGITLLLADTLFVLGLAFGASILYRMLFKPIWTYFNYLLTSNELRRCRNRAITLTGVACSFILIFLLAIPFPDYVRIEGVVEPVTYQTVYTKADGFLTASSLGGEIVPGEVLCTLENKKLENELARLGNDILKKELEYRLAKTVDLVSAQVLGKQITTLRDSYEITREKVSNLQVKAGESGIWLSNDLEKMTGRFMVQGTEIGQIVGDDAFIIRAVANQHQTQLVNESVTSIEVRVKGRPEQLHSAELQNVLPVGLEQLPSAALGYAVGGESFTSNSDQSGRATTESFFEIHFTPEQSAITELLPGQVLVIRCNLADKAIGEQLWRFVSQQFQKRFRIL